MNHNKLLEENKISFVRKWLEQRNNLSGKVAQDALNDLFNKDHVLAGLCFGAADSYLMIARFLWFSKRKRREILAAAVATVVLAYVEVENEFNKKHEEE